MFVVARAEGGQGGGRVFLFTRQDNNLCPFGAQGVLWTRAQVMQCRAGSSLFLFLMVTSRFFLGSSQVGLGIGQQCRIIALLESLFASYFTDVLLLLTQDTLVSEHTATEWQRLEFFFQFFWFQSIEIFLLLLGIWLLEVGEPLTVIYLLILQSEKSEARHTEEALNENWAVVCEGQSLKSGFLGSPDSSGTSHLSSQRLFSHL